MQSATEIVSDLQISRLRSRRARKTPTTRAALWLSYLKVVLDPGVELLELDIPQDRNQPVGALFFSSHGSLIGFN